MTALQFRHRIPSRLQKDIERAPRVFARHLDRGAHRGAQEAARLERRGAPKALSTLTQSVGVDRLGPGSYVVGPSTDYAEPVEQGTGRGGFPPIPALMAWIRVKHIQPDDPQDDAEDLAFRIARSIVHKGTPARPYVGPAFKAMDSRFMQIMREATADAMREARLA